MFTLQTGLNLRHYVTSAQISKVARFLPRSFVTVQLFVPPLEPQPNYNFLPPAAVPVLSNENPDHFYLFYLTGIIFRS